MEKFKKLLQIAKTGKIHSEGSKEPVTVEKVMAAADACRPFVFDNTVAVPKFKPGGGVEGLLAYADKAAQYFEETRIKEPNEAEIEEIDPPFEVFSIEYLHRSITIPRESDPIQVTTECVMCEEIDSGFRYYVLIKVGNGDDYQVAVFENDPGYSSVMKTALDMLNRLDLGVQKVRENVSYRLPGDKKNRNLSKDLVFIVGDRKNKKTFGKRDIQWTHSWDIRGHWRHYDREGFMGHDRKGVKNQPGRTWVRVGHKNKGGDPIKKTRVVKPKNDE